MNDAQRYALTYARSAKERAFQHFSGYMLWLARGLPFAEESRAQCHREADDALRAYAAAGEAATTTRWTALGFEPQVVAPGDVAYVIARTQQPVRPEYLFVTGGRECEILDFKIGMNSMLPARGPVGAVQWSVDEWDRVPERERRHRLQGDAMQVGTQAVLEVHNPTSRDLEFRAHMAVLVFERCY